MLTLNQAIEISKNFTFKHKRYGKNQSNNHFYFGTSWEEIASGGYLYPLNVVVKEPTTYSPNKMTWRFTYDFSDKVNTDRSNENHVLSDTEQDCIHLIHYLKEVSQNDDFLLTIGNISEITSYTEERTDDQVAGNYFSVEISAPIGEVACDLPIYSGNIFDGNYIYVGGSYIPITNSTMIKQDEFTYDGNPMVLTHVPDIMINSYAGGSVINPTDDYTIATKTVTPNAGHLLFEIGTKIKFTYTYQ